MQTLGRTLTRVATFDAQALSLGVVGQGVRTKALDPRIITVEKWLLRQLGNRDGRAAWR
jgi:hypothetical protein